MFDKCARGCRWSFDSFRVAKRKLGAKLSLSKNRTCYFYHGGDWLNLALVTKKVAGTLSIRRRWMCRHSDTMVKTSASFTVPARQQVCWNVFCELSRHIVRSNIVFRARSVPHIGTDPKRLRQAQGIMTENFLFWVVFRVLSGGEKAAMGGWTESEVLGCHGGGWRWRAFENTCISEFQLCNLFKQ